MKGSIQINNILLSIPRIKLAKLPTPLEPARRLGEVLGGIDLWFKRDDLTGFGLGGNKVRSLEYLAADAVKKGADMLVTGGSPESNHVRTTMATAAYLGLKGVAILPGTIPANAQGNFLLDKLLKTKFVFIGDLDRKLLDKHISHEVDRLVALGGKPYMIKRGGVSPLGCIGYVLAAIEISRQIKELNFIPDIIFCATGCGVTQAGLLLGFNLMKLNCKIYGVTVSRSRTECISHIKKLIVDTAEFLDLEVTIKKNDIVVFDEYIGEGYSVPTSESIQSIRLAARNEGIFLDPIYTGKAMAGLTDLIAKSRINSNNTVIFLHTGGSPSIFSHASSIDVSNNSMSLELNKVVSD